MKTLQIIAIIAILCLALVLVNGCTNQRDFQGAPEQGEEEPAEPTENETGNGEPSGEITGLTQEDLDELLAGIESIEAEDLGGLSD